MTANGRANNPLARCRFRTARLEVSEWRGLADQHGLDLAAVVPRILTAATTAELPSPWQGDYDRERTESWIAERNAESTTLLVVELDAGEPVGLVILFAVPGDGIEVRLGYVLAESAWGRGLASELVEGLAAWARSEPEIVALSGGVSHSNPASARVLEKQGFEPVSDEADQQTIANGERGYRLRTDCEE